jgi:hypothetical protein
MSVSKKKSFSSLSMSDYLSSKADIDLERGVGGVYDDFDDTDISEFSAIKLEEAA